MRVHVDPDPALLAEARVWRTILAVEAETTGATAARSPTVAAVEARLRELDRLAGAVPPDAAARPAGLGLAQLDLVRELRAVLGGPAADLPLDPFGRPVPDAEEHARRARTAGLEAVEGALLGAAAVAIAADLIDAALDDGGSA